MRAQALLGAMLACVVPLAGAVARPMTMLESKPSASAVIGARSTEFFVRFDGPVDHRRSRLTVTRNGNVVETLHPLLDSRPSVLFARAPRLAPGDYALHWTVISVAGAEITEGDIPFTVHP